MNIVFDWPKFRDQLKIGFSVMIEKIVFYLLLIDSIGCNLVVWFGEKWYTKHFRWLSRFFPPAKGWSLYYLLLVLWIGTLVYRVH